MFLCCKLYIRVVSSQYDAVRSNINFTFSSQFKNNKNKQPTLTTHPNCVFVDNMCSNHQHTHFVQNPTLKNFILWVLSNITISWKGHCACPGQPPPPADISVCDYLFNYILSASCKLLNEQMCSRNINCCSSIILNIIAYFLCLSSSNCGTHPICISSLFLVYMKKLLGHFCQYFERDPFLLYSSC